MGAETHNVRVLYSRKRKLIYQKWYLNLDTTRYTHVQPVQTTTMGTGTFVVVALAASFSQIKPAKINLSLIGRF